MKKLVAIITVIVLLSVLSSCTGVFGTLRPYPWQLAECWYCEEIDMTIRFDADSNGNLLKDVSSCLVIEKQEYHVGVGFHTSSVGFFVDKDGDGHSEYLLNGVWRYQNGNLVIQSNGEGIFLGQLSELIFIPYKE